MSTLIELQPAYLLHSRPFRDSSLILDFFTPDFGRISAVSRGGRNGKSKHKGLLQPFIPLHISLWGKNELKTLRTVELRQVTPGLKGERLFSALYMNEIIVRLFQGHEADPGFFRCYEQALARLVSEEDAEPVLRGFELSLLDALGYGIDFAAEAHTHQPVQAAAWYCFQAQSGFVKVQDPAASQVQEEGPGRGNEIYSGSCLLGIHAGDFRDAETRRTAKHVLRQILNAHLGTLPLRSRSLFSRR